MDKGFDGYLKRVEEILGKTALDVLILVCYLGIICTALLGALNFFLAITGEVPFGTLIRRILGVAIYIGVLCGVNWVALKHIRRKAKEAEEMVRISLEQSKETHSLNQNLLRHLKQLEKERAKIRE